MNALVEIGLKMMENIKGINNLEIILIAFFTLFFATGAIVSRVFWNYWTNYNVQIAEERRMYFDERKQFAIDAKKDREAIMALYEENSVKNELHSNKIELLVEKMANAVNGSARAIDGNTSALAVFKESLQLNNELIKTYASNVAQQTLLEATRRTA